MSVAGFVDRLRCLVRPVAADEREYQGMGRATGSADAGAPNSAAVVVIGAGVNGASTAFQLTKRGVKDVVLIERRQLGAGASGKSGALVRCHYANPHEATLTLESLKVFRNWEDVVGHGSPGFEGTGFIQVVKPEDEAALRANVAALQEVGVETSIASAQELGEIEPLLRTDDLTYGAFEPGSGWADPNGTLYGFVAAAKAGGATVCTDTEAIEILTEGDRVSGVATNRGTIATETVVLAGGAWADRLLMPLDVDLKLKPRRIQVVVFRQPPEVDPRRRHRVVIDTTQRSWFRPEGFSSTLIGVERGSRPHDDPDELDETAEDAFVQTARDALAARMPVFAHATMRGCWAGVVMSSPDGHPIIDQIPGIPGLFVMAGDSGTSFKTSPAIGICLAEWITEGAPKLVDLTPFRAKRILDDALWLDPLSYGRDSELSISR